MRELVIEASAANLEAVLDFVNAELEAHDCPMKTITQINIAVEEVFVNIASYAYAPGTGKTVIRVSVNGGAAIDFEDSGKPYNPLGKPDPDISLPAEEREPGGLGIYMVKNIMDDVEYYHESGKNRLTIKKSFQ